MVSEILAWIAAGLIGATATGVLLSRDWRWALGLLGVQYLGEAILVAQHWPLGMAAAKLVTGWMVTAALGITLSMLPRPEQGEASSWPQGRPFRLFLAGMVMVVAIAVTPQVQTVMAGAGPPVIIGMILLTGIGLLQLGTNAQVSATIFGLLTVLAGFEVLYAAIEGSILVAGLLALVNLGLGLVGAYLMNASVAEDIP